MSGAYHYAAIKEMAKARGCKVTDLIALSANRDPFYVGKPSDHQWGNWFSDLWNGWFSGKTGVHLRRMHYRIVSQDPPIPMPNGTPYENTERCWEMLVEASAAARYLGLVDPAALVDRRNPEPIEPDVSISGTPSIGIDIGDASLGLELPDLPDWPGYSLAGCYVRQPYYLEIWCEKSTMNDELKPLCSRYGVALVTGAGELSITAAHNAVRRIQQRRQPARIFYVSDFDPAGASMPVSISRKIEYFIERASVPLDIRLYPVVLTIDQVRRYTLPRTPIKEGEKRRAGFEKRYGEGAVELDALEALHPGELRRILRSEIMRYYDDNLIHKVSEYEATIDDRLADIRHNVLADYSKAITSIEEEHAAIKTALESRIKRLEQAYMQVGQEIVDDLEGYAPDISDDPLPEGARVEEIDDALFDSMRDYDAQLNAYKAFQGRENIPDAAA